MTEYYELAASAKEDLKQIHQHGVFTYGEQQADSYYFAFFERFKHITEQPYSYQSADNICDGYRRAVYGSHSIYYRIDDNQVTFIRILSRQNPGQAVP